MSPSMLASFIEVSQRKGMKTREREQMRNSQIQREEEEISLRYREGERGNFSQIKRERGKEEEGMDGRGDPSSSHSLSSLLVMACDDASPFASPPFYFSLPLFISRLFSSSLFVPFSLSLPLLLLFRSILSEREREKKASRLESSHSARLLNWLRCCISFLVLTPLSLSFFSLFLSLTLIEEASPIRSSFSILWYITTRRKGRLNIYILNV